MTPDTPAAAILLAIALAALVLALVYVEIRKHESF